MERQRKIPAALPKEVDVNLIRLYILLDAAEQQIFATSEAYELRKRGFTVTDASTRRILRALERKGCLASDDGGTRLEDATRRHGLGGSN